MTRGEFREQAESLLQQAQLPSGTTTMVDAADGSVYEVTAWANRAAIWFDDYWQRGSVGWPAAYERATLSTTTLFIAAGR